MISEQNLCNTKVTTLSYNAIVEQIIIIAKKRIPAYVCALNVHMFIEAFDSPAFNEVVNKAYIVTSDGMPITKVLKWLYKVEQERVAGMDFTPSLFKEAEEQGIGVYFFGNTQKNLKELALKLSKEYPELILSGFISPPFSPPTDEETDYYIKKINQSGAGLVFVSLGCPKQEKWMHANSPKINAVLLGIGNAISTYIGAEKRPPKWIQKIGMEWFYRLIQDPNRLFKRYFYTNTKFIYLLSKLLIKKYLRIGIQKS